MTFPYPYPCRVTIIVQSGKDEMTYDFPYKKEKKVYIEEVLIGDVVLEPEGKYGTLANSYAADGVMN